MRKEDKKYLQELLENSEIRSSRETLRKLSENLVSFKQFKTSLQQKFSMEHIDLSEIISETISLWVIMMGKEATLTNFEKILRRLDLKTIAGKRITIFEKVWQYGYQVLSMFT